ncbi:heterokaryon incompatibility protein-domain-containing protein [Sordaria brevicollis]|uniref:Heterokaryon incompatibility protein-domain-containing protein n=1 Tax=Sordaria brevicollis TaxID=83679 RepID=A0AAE0UER2_SORBR|nr:heterokaryon incompatibility protein-domain-containing protein [Sordaria brevicollis]
MLTEVLLDTDILYPQLVSNHAEECLPFSTGSTDALKPAKVWLQDCLQYHQDCHPDDFSPGSERLPTRLVDIGDVQGHITPRLVITPNSATLANTPYLTLSHSWAITAVHNIKLSVSNLTTLQEVIPWDGLSQTFKDALKIAQSLGYRYIWIDSLCIIQDSREDWEREALTMSTVYGHSICNLAALDIDGVDQCFAERNPLEFVPCRISKPNAQSTIYAATRDKGLRRFPEPGRIPLLDRGWVFQERMLPPRLLHFGGEQVYWECRHHAISEAHPIKKNFDEYLWTFGPFTPRGKLRALCDTTTEPKARNDLDFTPTSGQVTTMDPTLLKLLQHWQEILTNYTITSLTCSSDRLIALAGVVQTIKFQTGLTYLPISGTWKEFWPLDLLWNFRQVLALRFPSDTGAPSWSWAATEGAKEF